MRVGGGGNDRPTAGAFEAPGEKERLLTEGAHSTQLVFPSLALPMAPGTCMRTPES